MSTLAIGTLKLKSNLILSPMAGVSDLPFRMLNREFGCELAFVEMVNVRSLGYNSIRTRQMLKSTGEDSPLGVQLLGKEPQYLKRAMGIIEDYKFDILDFNAACPAKKVTRRGEGASLLKEPKKLNQLLKLIIKESAVPVTAKIRIGWDDTSRNAVQAALYAQDAGIAALFVHGRTKEQGYSGSVDYKSIHCVKKGLDIPVIASGDIFSPLLAKKMFDETGCDAIAIARGSLGNPWIFRQIQAFLKEGKLISKPQKQEIIEVMTRHLKMCVEFYGERTGVMMFRKFFGWYTKGFRKVRPLRERSSRAKTEKQMSGIINSCRDADYGKSP